MKTEGAVAEKGQSCVCRMIINRERAKLFVFLNSICLCLYDLFHAPQNFAPQLSCVKIKNTNKCILLANRQKCKS